MSTRWISASVAAGVLGVAAFVTPNVQAAPATASYIVVLEPGAGSPDRVAGEMSARFGGKVGYVYEHALQGFSMTMSPRAAAALERNPRVAYVQPDGVVSINAQVVPTGIQRIFADGNANIGIDGTDERVDVDVAVIDTGVDFEHPDLDVVGGVTCTESGGGPPWSRSASCSAGGDDDHYHGTHVAGTVAALDNGDGVVGVAPGARIWAVKVLSSSGSGSESMVVAGIDWVAANAATIEVANMSLGGSGYSKAEYDAIQGAVNAGVAFAVAAGNDDGDANNYSPAAFDNALTVSALADFDGAPGASGAPTCRTDQDDTLADFSNWGNAVQIAAPGVCIRSTYPVERGSYGTISGTSMASPHAAGALALLASADNPGNAIDVYNLYDAVIDAGNFNWTDDSGDGIKEPLLDVSNTTLFAPVLVGVDGGGQDPPPEPDTTAPTVSISSPAEGATFTQDDAITFVGSAQDNVDGDLTAQLTWSSSVDGYIGAGGSFSTSDLSVGQHTITATAVDTLSNTGSDTVTVNVTAVDSAGQFTLSAAARKVKGEKYADLTWSGTTTTNVDVYRGGAVVATTANDGAYSDGPLGKGGGSATYQVCEAGTTTCSNSVTVTW